MTVITAARNKGSKNGVITWKKVIPRKTIKAVRIESETSRTINVITLQKTMSSAENAIRQFQFNEELAVSEAQFNTSLFLCGERDSAPRGFGDSQVLRLTS